MFEIVFFLRVLFIFFFQAFQRIVLLHNAIRLYAKSLNHKQKNYNLLIAFGVSINL